MTCDACRSKILATESPAKLPADLTAHLATCAACRAVQRQAKRVDALVAKLPVAEAAEAKARFLAKVEKMPAVERSTARTPQRLAWPMAIAAALLLTVGGYFYFSKPKNVPEVAAKPRHELLNKEVAYVTRLAKANDVPTRVRIWTEWTKDLRGETCDVIRLAPAQDLDELAKQYARAVNEGLVKQVKLLPDHPTDIAERNRLLDDARAALKTAEADANRLLGESPPHAQKALDSIKNSATAGLAELDKLPKGGAS